jgi:hypothetical protein
MARPAFTVVALALVGLTSACHQATILVPTTEDGLRAQLRDRTSEVESLKLANAQLEQQLGECAKGAEARTGISAEAIEATPRLVSLRIGTLSHFEAGADASGACVATVYIEPQDGLGRFLQIVGALELAAFELSSTGVSKALGSATFSPLAVRDAWRGGITGSHYTFAMPLSTAAWNCSGSVTLRASFVDGLTGATLSAQREIAELRATKSGTSHAE